jgi:hypothetical protein
MSAVDTASRVLGWVTADAVGGPPTGDLTAAAELAAPPPDLARALGGLAAVATARLGLTAPPLGDPRPPGLGAALLAAAVGGRGDTTAAYALLEAVPECGGPDGTAEPTGYDLVSRHLLVQTALASGEPGDADVAELLRAGSPLTCVLDRPAEGMRYQAEALLTRRLLRHAEGRRLVIRAFAEPPADLPQATWRAGMLGRLRRRDQDFVLEVYETGLRLFGAEHRRRARRGLARAARLAKPGAQAELRLDALWWRGLSEIERARPWELRRYRHITEYLDGVRLYRRLRMLEGAA